MENISVAAAKSQLSAILDRVEAGEEVVITRRGKAVARLTAEKPAKRGKGSSLAMLAAFRATLPISPVSTEAFVREQGEHERF